MHISQANLRETPVLLSDYGHYPSIIDKIRSSIDRETVRVLFTDVDATFVLGAGHSPQEVQQSLDDMRSLTATLHQRGFIIVPVTGSHLDSGTQTTNSILNRVIEGMLPAVGDHVSQRAYCVDAYVCDGGAVAVQSIRDNQTECDSSYARFITPTQLDYEKVLQSTKDLAAAINQVPLTNDELDNITLYDNFASSERIHEQPGTLQGRHRESNKIAFYFYASNLEQRDQIEEQFKHAVRPYGLQVVCCEEKDANSAARRHPGIAPLIAQNSAPLKYCLDIVPFTKGDAIRYFSDYIQKQVTEIALELNLRRPRVEVWACGDSGNDLPLMSAATVDRVVIVGGASGELIRASAPLREAGKEVFVDTNPSRLGPASILAALAD